MSLVVVGASLAGLRAVESARRAGYDGSITLVGAESRVPYDRPPLSKQVLDPSHELGSPADVAGFHTVEHLRDELGADLRLGTPATGLDVTGREVLLGEDAVGFDSLIVATGSSPRRLTGVPELAGVHELRTAEDALAVRAALDAGARTVVVGAGFIGAEVASAARQRGLAVTIVEAATVPLVRAVGDQAAEVFVSLHRAAGTDLRLGVGVSSVEHADGRVTGVVLTDGSRLPAELVVVGVGTVPATGWLEGSGVPLHETDRGVVTDATLWTGLSGIWAAGDVVHSPNALFDDELMRIEHWTNAAEQGMAAGRHAVDPSAASPLAPVPYFWSDWYGHRIQFVGIPRAEEVLVVDPGRDGVGFCALYRRGDRVVGALTVDRPGDIMKLRRSIAGRSGWADGVAFARERTAVPSA